LKGCERIKIYDELMGKDVINEFENQVELLKCNGGLNE
jgi:hypothetical protein